MTEQPTITEPTVADSRLSYRIVVTTQLVRLHDEVEVRDGQTNLIVNDSSMAGFVQVRELTDEDLDAFGHIIDDAGEN